MIFRVCNLAKIGLAESNGPDIVEYASLNVIRRIALQARI